jgi:hypothetical protein
MKAFLVGLLFLIAASVLITLGCLLFPIFLLLGLLLRIVFVIAFGFFAIWLLGKLIIFIWGKLEQNEDKKH